MGSYNPGGYGNNGCTIEQLIGYRLIILNVGTFTAGVMHDEDFGFFEEWLGYTDCGLGDIRRGLIFDGDEVADAISGEAGGHLDFLNNVLGVTRAEDPYREYNNDPAYCVYLEPVTGAAFAPTGPGISLYGNGCPQEYDYNVLGVTAGVSGATGNLSFYSYQHTGTNDYTDFAQIVREKTEPGAANWRTVVNGFSMHHLSERGCGGEDCSNDSACIVSGIIDLLAPQIEWMRDPQAPFVTWGGACRSEAVEQEHHLSGPVNHLYASRPNPFHSRATIRFSIARRGEVAIEIYDVSGRLRRTVADGIYDAGEHSLTWDGADDAGRRTGAGIYWMQMRTDDGYESSKRMIRLQ